MTGAERQRILDGLVVAEALDDAVHSFVAERARRAVRALEDGAISAHDLASEIVALGSFLTGTEPLQVLISDGDLR